MVKNQLNKIYNLYKSRFLKKTFGVLNSYLKKSLDKKFQNRVFFKKSPILIYLKKNTTELFFKKRKYH